MAAKTFHLDRMVFCIDDEGKAEVVYVANNHEEALAFAHGFTIRRSWDCDDDAVARVGMEAFKMIFSIDNYHTPDDLEQFEREWKLIGSRDQDLAAVEGGAE